MRTPGQRGPFGDWLQRVRSARFRTQRDALRAFEKLAGLVIAPSEYAQWESGSRVPRDDNPKVARLYDFFGSRPGELAHAEPLDQSDIAAAIDRQTVALEDLAKAIREVFATADMRSQSRAEVLLSRVEAIAATVGAPAPEASTESGDTPATPRTEDAASGHRSGRHRNTEGPQASGRTGRRAFVEPLPSMGRE